MNEFIPVYVRHEDITLYDEDFPRSPQEERPLLVREERKASTINNSSPNILTHAHGKQLGGHATCTSHFSIHC